MKTKVAAIQLVSTQALEPNLESVSRLVQNAVQAGAQVVLLPEYWSSIGYNDSEKLAQAEAFGEGPLQTFLSNLAKEHRIYLIGGTISLKANAVNKVRNSTLVFDENGQCVSRYDKIHLFKYDGAKDAYDESLVIEPGEKPVLASTPVGQIGLSVCYDLRFPELYRAYVPCDMIVVPASFLYTTGQKHWETLLKARAIENQTYILAAAQGGRHETGRKTWGHSMLIDPWGEIVSVLPEGEGFVIGEIDQDKLVKIRERLPSIYHRQLK